MDKNSNIVITGAAGFIGSCMSAFLNQKGFNNLILVDDFSEAEKEPNLSGKKFSVKIEREVFFEWLGSHHPAIDFVYHIGARTDTTEFDYSIHEHLNVEYSKKVWKYCTEQKVPLVYASSAATYGMGEFGYSDSHDIIKDLKPLNPYGVSKNEFDKWVLQQKNFPPGWAGLKFFNVYGPNEYHKKRMASVIFHAYNQIREKGFVKLFKSHNNEFGDGEQLRDFVYIKDVLSICYWFLETWAQRKAFPSAIYNLGTGKARSFNELAKATFSAMNKHTDIQYIDMPEDIRDTYQYYTQAEMQKMKEAGYGQKMYSLEQGVNDYVKNYLSKMLYY
jgi:ADP-L-glycero-D-manno-heptose 6-epimerase